MKPEPQLPRLDRQLLPAPMQAAYDRALATRGDASFVQVAGHAPEVFEWYGEFYRRVFYGGRLPVRIKELVRLRLSTVHGCAFCKKGNRQDTLDEPLYREARQFFDDAQLFELGMTMAVLTGMAKFLFTFDLVEKEDYCEFGAVTSPGNQASSARSGYRDAC